jgi:OTU domain-containing protein 5
LRPTAADGNCLFRAIALQVYGDADMHDTVRQLCMKHMAAERDHYSQFVAEDFDAYLARKRQLGVHGNNAELQAIGELYNRPIQVYRDDVPEPVNLFHGDYAAANPLRLAYHGACHYSALIDPQAPTVGVGLGLPGLEPGAADRAHLQTAIRDSEELAVGDALVKAAVAASEADLIQDELLRAALQESRAAAPVRNDDLNEVLQRSRVEFFASLLAQHVKGAN